MVRLWEGFKIANISNETFYAFLSQVLLPTTISANPDSLQAYLPIILDPNQPLPPDAFLKTLPFHEAALVVHKDQQAYDDARRKNPWYGPAHFLKDGGFDEKLSFSATPKPFTGTLEVVGTEREKRVGFDFRDPAKTSAADWQKGYVVVSVILRRENTQDADYTSLAAEYSKAIQTELASALDGHLVRVGPGHILEFLRFSDREEYERFRPVLDQISARFQSNFIFDYYRKPVETVQHGTAQAGPGKAFSIQFERPFRGCGNALKGIGP